MITLISCECISRLGAKLPINIAPVITLVLESLLDINHYLIGWEIRVGEYRAIINITDEHRIVAPCWKPVTTVPIPVTAPVRAAHKGDVVVMASPPPVIVPSAMVSGVQGMIISPV